MRSSIDWAATRKIVLWLFQLTKIKRGGGKYYNTKTYSLFFAWKNYIQGRFVKRLCYFDISRIILSLIKASSYVRKEGNFIEHTYFVSK